MKRSAAAAVAAVGLALGVVGSVCTCIAPEPQSPSPAGGGDPVTANIWVDTSGGTCADSGTLIAYPGDGTECGSLAAAVAAAEAGDVIGWKGGTYTQNETIAYKSALANLSPACDPYGEWGSASTTNCVKVVPETGETITLNGYLTVKTGSVWIKGAATGTITAPDSRAYNISVRDTVSTEANSVTQYPDHVIIEGIDTRMLGSLSTDFNHFRDIDVGPASVGTSGGCGVPGAANSFENVVGYGGGITVLPTDIVWERVYIHDQNRNSNGNTNDCHWGGLFVKGTDGFTVRSSVFSQNVAYHIQHQAVGAPSQPSNITYENNWFGCTVNEEIDGPDTVCLGLPAITFAAAATFSNYLIRFNSGGDLALAQCSAGPCAYSNVRFIGNAGTKPAGSGTQPCGASGVTFDDNVWVGGTCGAGDTTETSVAALFVDEGVGDEDFHLLNGTNAANNFVTTSTGDYALTEDIDGASRPAGANRDAGSDEQ